MGGVLLNSDDVPILRKIVKDHKRKNRSGTQQRKRWPNGGGGGGGVEVLFSIASVDCTADPKSAVLDILSRDCNRGTVPQETDLEQITAYDKVGCNLNEPEADLIGRKGYARYMKGTGAYDVCEWEIKFICCAEDTCG